MDLSTTSPSFCALTCQKKGTTMMESDSFILLFDSQDTALANAGGKGLNLSLLTRASFPVPPGLLITTQAYRAFMQANHLQQPIMDVAADQAETSEQKSAAIRQLFACGHIPPDLTAAITQAYAELRQRAGDVPLAVRSSATAEDLPGASFAGQQETYLNVVGTSALLTAVQHCWASLWTARALDYRTRQHIDPSSVSLAVVVQVMVPAQASGILFTANPLSGAHDEVVIDAAWGLGEAIVGGLVTPDHVVAAKATGTIIHMTVADKTVMTHPTATGTEECPVEASKRRAPVLTPAQVSELVQLGAAIETYYGSPQDIEWCFAQGQFFIVQARPITTLPPEPVTWDNPLAGAKWLKDIQAAEWATEPLSPLGATTTFAAMIQARQRAFPMQQSPWYALINGWLYIRADFRRLRMMGFLMGWVARLLAGRLEGNRRVRRLWPRQLTLLDALEKTNLASLADAALQAHADQLLETLGWWWWEVSYDTSVDLHTQLLLGMLRVPGLADPAVLFRGNDSLLLEAERALREATHTGEIAAYLARFGHFVESADPIHPTLREAPELLNQQLAAARQSPMGPDERLARTRSARKEAERLVQALRGPRGFLAGRLLVAGQSHAAHIDDAVFHFQRMLALVRATFLEAGRRLARVGSIERAEEVFYLQQAEVWAPPAGLAQRIKERRLGRARNLRLAPPPSIPPLSDPIWGKDRMLSMTTQAGVHEHNGRRVVVGTTGSPGRARGTARVIAGPDDFRRFQPGEVLVAHTTTPVWTPLFSIASAAVTEVGGPFSHAAIVAREFGIPLVIGALDAVREIPDGTPVVVDGSAGRVSLEDGGRNEGQQAPVHLGHGMERQKHTPVSAS